ncbi:hypothetical protein V6N11_002598 [Hibiscus sabdariffa]|uniref:Uncharacterized protein n=1 Tax=Hibiscus sabdariffa TaxID=183260 RepID=A0ABR2SAP5_9ROSI
MNLPYIEKVSKSLIIDDAPYIEEKITNDACESITSESGKMHSDERAKWHKTSAKYVSIAHVNVSGGVRYTGGNKRLISVSVKRPVLLSWLRWNLPLPRRVHTVLQVFSTGFSFIFITLGYLTKRKNDEVLPNCERGIPEGS